MGKSVTTYLIDGDPNGTKYAFISNKICQMYVIPRSNLSILAERRELQTPAFISCWEKTSKQNLKHILEKQRIFVSE